ncbi:uncharacterized protein C2845_PM06G06610 [Panicum miliaceum]|uniref:KIB1-4 beta-propeller domain-containing protein n=1 Tax=Panicum miliaceum TaxID=4540 RepID=A0A3L6RC33_PANMI|nr:uncharacterized protein C2845_PM06G06610 [Panicum miliaceum]
MRALIAERALDTDEKDLIRFRAVCSAWRDSIGGENRINRGIHPRRWILLPEASDATLCKFGNIATGECIQLQNLHQLANHTVAEGPHGNPEGMLVLRDDTSFVIRLFNPLTRQLIHLPSLKTLVVGVEGDDDQMPDEEFGELYEVTAAGFVGGSKLVLYFHAIKMIAVAKPGDEDWEVVTYDQPLMSVATIGDHFYCLSTESLFELDASTSPPQLVVVSQVDRPGNIILDTMRLVDNGGELLVLWNELHLHPQGFWHLWYAVRRIDLNEGLMIPTYYLNDRAVVVGPSGAISVSTAHFPELDANTIYFRYGCNKDFIKQCALSNTYEYYRSPPGSFAKCLGSYVANFAYTTCPH